MSAESSVGVLTATSHELLSKQYVYTGGGDSLETVTDRFAVDKLLPDYTDPVLRAADVVVGAFMHNTAPDADGYWRMRGADIGGNNGRYARHIVSKGGHRMRTKMLLIDPAASAENLPGGMFVPWGASDVPGVTPMPHYAHEVMLGEEELDYAALHYMLYHVKDQAGLLERVTTWLKPNALATFATSGKGNKSFLHDEFEKMVAYELEERRNAGLPAGSERLRVTPPPRFNQSFTLENAKDVIGDYFEVNDKLTIIQKGEVDFNHPKRLQVIAKAAATMRTAIDPVPPPQELKKAINNALVKLVLGKSAVEAGLNEKEVDIVLNDTGRWKHQLPLEHVARGVLFAIPKERRARHAARTPAATDWDKGFEFELQPQPAAV